MHLNVVLACLLALLPALSSAFHPYLPDGYKKARKNVHLGQEVSKGFNEALEKLPLHKRSVPRGLTSFPVPSTEEHGTLVKRLNDFNIDTSTNPTMGQSAAIDEDSTDFSYFSEVVIGSGPGEKYYLLMDTGSSALWVMGSNCTTKACKSHDTLGNSNSDSLSIGDDAFNVQYASGTVEGLIGTDSIQVAGLNVKMQLGLANETSDDFDNYPMDGILGLARQPGSGFAPPTFLQILQQTKALKSNIFGVNLQRAADNTNDGEINFGGIDTSKFQGDLTYISTTSDGNFWQIPTNGFVVDGKVTKIALRDAIIDTGTSYLFMPPSEAKQLLSEVPGSTTSDGESWNIPCDTNIDIALIFGLVAYSISPKDYVGQRQSNGMCMSHIFGQSVSVLDEEIWLVGDTFLKNVYTVFDMDQSRIGFGAKGKSTNLTSDGSGPSTSASQSSDPSTPTGSTPSSNPSSSPSAQASGPVLPGPGQTSGQSNSSSPPSPTTSSGDTTSSSAPVSTITGAGCLVAPISFGHWVSLVSLSLFMFL